MKVQGLLLQSEVWFFSPVKEKDQLEGRRRKRTTVIHQGAVNLTSGSASSSPVQRVVDSHETMTIR